MKRPSELKRMSPKALSRYIADMGDEVMAAHAALSLAKREQRARRKAKGTKARQRATCGQPAPVQPWQHKAPDSLH